MSLRIDSNQNSCKVLTTRNVLSKQNQSEIFRTQEKNEEPNVKLIDIEAFLLKVTSKRQAITPSSDLARNAHLSYVPPCVIQKFSHGHCEQSKIKNKINILTGMK
uniref:Uncharacterized protein n=1 Tax=Euplotes harpa TaxID=151035 RepID=A0A7S3JL35_9SPIT|mmetsp:Transcript_7453/g.8417  ORF Transcript_7453/g.8417 Transcript_7453/m.8417 type:complete len:105 (+) Transcript_7453:344-658(+)